jgi:hypothetical protein
MILDIGRALVEVVEARGIGVLIPWVAGVTDYESVTMTT